MQSHIGVAAMGAQTSRRSDVSVIVSPSNVSVASDSEACADADADADHDSYDGDVEDLEKTFASLQIEQPVTPPPEEPEQPPPHESPGEEFDVEKFRKVNQKVVSPEEATVQRNGEMSTTKHEPLPEYDFLDEQIIASIEKEMMDSEYY